MSFFNIHVFHKNMNILRKIAGLKKAEFSEMLGVKNVFRKDYNSIGPKLLYGIKQHFDGVDEDWLLEDHGDEEIDVRLKNDRAYEQRPERMTPGDYSDSQDSDRGSYGIPDLGGHQVQKVMTSLSPEEISLIEAIREIDPVSRVGILSTAINQLNEAKRDPNIGSDKRKIGIIDRAIKMLGRAISEC